MAAWHIPLQIASFKGVSFDIFSLEESNNKSLVEHAYPYVDGTDLEDMGLGTHNVQMSAVYWGYGFDARVKRLLNTLAQPGGGVLVHPVMGRMPDMVAESYSVRYNAEEVNYVTVDLSFKKSTTGNPIFAESNSLICLIDKIAAEFNAAIARANAANADGLGGIMANYNAAQALAAAVSAVLNDITGFFDGLIGGGEVDLSTPKSVINAIDGTVRSILCRCGRRKSSGENDNTDFGGGNTVIGQITAAADIKRRAALAVKSLPLSTKRFLSPAAEKLINQLLTQSLTQTVFAAAVTVIEENDQITPPEVLAINHAVREQLQASITAVQSNQLMTDEQRYQIIESLRDQAKQINQLSQVAINRRPPLIVKVVGNDTSMHQLAHRYYRDYRRADELARLNPHLRHPSFIRRGVLLNAYAR